MEKPPPNRPRILIVEDDPVTASDIRSSLERQGFPVVATVASGAEARQTILQRGADLAVLDIKLETLDGGIEISRSIRESHGIPSIFVTGYSREAVFSKVRESDIVGFLRKPFSDEELLACVEAAAETRESNDLLDHQLPGLRAMAARLTEPLLIANRSGSIRFANQALAEATGWPADEIHGRPLEELITADPEGETAGKGSRKILLQRREGAPWRGIERISPIHSSSGDLVGMVSILTAGSPPATANPVADTSAGDGSGTPRAGNDTVGVVPAVRSSALEKIASLSRDPAFRELIRKKPVPPPSPLSRASSSPALPSPPLPAGKDPHWDEVDDPVLRVDGEGVIRLANRAAQDTFGSGGSLAGKPLGELFSDEDFEESEGEFLKPFSTGKKHCFELDDRRRKQSFEVRVYRSGKGLLVLFSQSADSDSARQEWVRQQRLEGLGLLARGFAHDFNNHLTTITGNVGLARERHPDDEELHQMLGEAQTAAFRATGLVQQLMTFAQGGRPIRKHTRVPDLVRRILTEHRLQHPEIRFQFQGADVDLVANIDPAQISRLVENLVANSAVAMADGGILIVRCARVTPEEVIEIRDSHIPAEEDHLLIEVIDTGHGMDEESLNQVFEPYFTTRKQDNASGIGLTVCESIARAHGGFIQLQSKEGKGTIATFCAPVGQSPDFDTSDVSLTPEALPPLPAPNAPELQSPGGGENILVGTRILILEDDAPIRRLMAATLRRAGHEVVETKDGRETVAVYREALEKNAKFHLLICDLTIENGMGGVETMKQLTQLDPSILAIVSSGYSDAPAMSSPGSFGFRGVLPKPYAPSELRAAVHRILSAHRIIA